MPTNDSSKHEIVLRATHEPRFNGYKTAVVCGVRGLDMPDVCGCITSFKSAGYTETGDDGIAREVWVQDGFRFNKHVTPL